MTLQKIAEIIISVLPVLGSIGIWLQIQNYRSKTRFDKIEFIEKTRKVLEIYGDDGFKKMDEELAKDELFFLRTGMDFRGKLRRAFVNKFDDLINNFSFGQLYMIKTYFKTVNEKLSVKSKRDMMGENIFIFAYWGLISSLLFSLLILSFLLETPDWARFVFGLLAGLSCIPIVKQIVVLKFIAEVRLHLDAD